MELLDPNLPRSLLLLKSLHWWLWRLSWWLHTHPATRNLRYPRPCLHPTCKRLTFQLTESWTLHPTQTIGKSSLQVCINVFLEPKSDLWVFSIPLVIKPMVFRVMTEPLCWCLPLTISPEWNSIFEDGFCLLASFESTSARLLCLLKILALALRLWMMIHCSTCASLIQSFLSPCGALGLYLTRENCTTLCSSRFSFGIPFGKHQTSFQT